MRRIQPDNGHTFFHQQILCRDIDRSTDHTGELHLRILDRVSLIEKTTDIMSSYTEVNLYLVGNIRTIGIQWVDRIRMLVAHICRTVSLRHVEGRNIGLSVHRTVDLDHICTLKGSDVKQYTKNYAFVKKQTYSNNQDTDSVQEHTCRIFVRWCSPYIDIVLHRNRKQMRESLKDILFNKMCARFIGFIAYIYLQILFADKKTCNWPAATQSHERAAWLKSVVRVNILSRQKSETLQDLNTSQVIMGLGKPGE